MAIAKTANKPKHFPAPAYKLRHKVDQNFQVWQEVRHPKIIESDDVMWQKIEYIDNNLLRRDYVDDRFIGDIAVLAITPANPA